MEAKRKAPEPELKFTQDLQMYTSGFHIDSAVGGGTHEQLWQWEEAYHGSDYKSFVAELDDPDWELMVMAVRLRDKLHDVRVAAEKALKAELASLSNEELAKRLRFWHQNMNELREEAAKRLREIK